ncbi:MAG: hypothetical protein IKO68_11340 [Oscillospiraceae bacterium]|nr:hypothetical protein [Oscillospiraceae bacterium]
MKYLFRFLLAIGLGFLLAGTVLAADPPPANGVEISMSVSLPLPDYDTIFHDNGDENDPESLTIRQLEWLDRAWACRDKDCREDCHLVLLEDGILLADEQARGSLEFSWRFPAGDWRRILCCQESDYIHPDRAGSHLDPRSGASTLQVRLFTVATESERCACQVTMLLDEAGDLIWMNTSVRGTSEAQGAALRLELLHTENDEAGPLSWTADDPNASETETQKADTRISEALFEKEQTWTYQSSDGRPLWQAILHGSFVDGHCIDASGKVIIFDEAWECSDALFYPDEDKAVARITLKRRVIGIVVAERSFRLILDSGD